MSTIQEDVHEWLLTQQEWLQVAADRLMRKGVLSDDDMSEITAILKTPAGQIVTKNRIFEGLIVGRDVGHELRLNSIGSVVGIENLSPRHPLVFGPGNLTIIYGHNGSGKSSYSRIIKRASGKPRAIDLKHNVFQPAPIDKKCTISYKYGEENTVTEWIANGDVIENIRATDIFDSDEAGHYLSKENAAAYTPPMVAMFESLASTSDRIRDALQAEQDRLVSVLPVVPAAFLATERGKQYVALHGIKELALKKLLNWTELDGKNLDELVERLKVVDPAALARQKRATKLQVEQLITTLNHTAKNYGLAHVELVRMLRNDAWAKRKIATEAAQVVSARLDGVGSATWRALWSAAKSYSATAYPQQVFPVTNDAFCVLCHQELNADAQQRLKDFENFVQSKLESEAKAAEALYGDILKDLPVALNKQQIDTQCEAAGVNTEEWKQHFYKFWTMVMQVRSSLLTDESTEMAFPVDEQTESLRILREYILQLELDAQRYDIDAMGFDRVKAENAKLELEAQKWISQQAAAVLVEVERLKKIKIYDSWKTLTNSRKISIKASDVSEKFITQAYVARFNKELQALGARKIQIELIKSRTSRAKVYHQLRLKGVKNDKTMPEAILSEGERRIISLAAFLADVADKPQIAPFIFDDPISSLDHDFEWSVAVRLAELAKSRQVLVFTHRLSLYGLLDDAAKKIGEDWKKRNFTQLCIEAFSGAAGHPVEQAVWNGKTEKANNILITRIDAAKKVGEESGAEMYRGLAQGICSDFRKLLERTVEDDLFNEVVKRHRRSITTDNRLGTIHSIESDDCQLIDRLMTKYSFYEHSQSQEIPAFIPEAVELKADIELLKQWRTDFTNRRKLAAA
ncbi:restriction endonuclease [Janthinobacterium agaricidamnosum]|uniref:Restriction endonuclease n=1 Tax=Janthinobacterium agaricidamnosum TaxID=55508 RepID=A0A3G2E8L2_9BURK|nr:AAA family ATPase [Janthinobacterium agaricidamnosum]AYM76581.1 restriction endonuclease [Janthinobacterium agaricidamnosum]